MGGGGRKPAFPNATAWVLRRRCREHSAIHKFTKRDGAGRGARGARRAMYTVQPFGVVRLFCRVGLCATTLRYTSQAHPTRHSFVQPLPTSNISLILLPSPRYSTQLARLPPPLPSTIIVPTLLFPYLCLRQLSLCDFLRSSYHPPSPLPNNLPLNGLHPPCLVSPAPQLISTSLPPVLIFFFLSYPPFLLAFFLTANRPVFPPRTCPSCRSVCITLPRLPRP